MSKKAGNSAVGSVASCNNIPGKSQSISANENSPETKFQFPELVLKPSNGSPKLLNPSIDDQKELSSLSSTIHGQHSEIAIKWRPLKLVYDDDIRLVQMPVDCSFRILRDIISKIFS